MSKISGIYVIRNIRTGTCYVGQSVDVLRRWRQHYKTLTRGKNNCRYLQRAWDLYGIEDFTCLIVETCEPDRLTELEQSWLDTITDKYNTSPCARSNLGSKWSDESRKNHPRIWLGKKMPESTKEKMRKSAPKHKPQGFGEKISRSLTGIKRKPRPESEKLHRIETARKKSGKPFKDQFGTIYMSTGHASELLGTSRPNIRYALHNGTLLLGKYQLMYLCWKDR